MVGALETLGDLLSRILPLDIYGQTVNVDGSRPSNRRGGHHVLDLTHPDIVRMCLHVPLYYAIVHKTNLGYAGAAQAIIVALWFNIILLEVYMICYADCGTPRTFILRDVFLSIKEF
ncbi:hypothetical protein V6N11_047941 [Hibiscus sabdariffa]|uniref:Uncharacterized protein n=1 Tax=Hibiscus sabdariffa TaxID=183260 RepID=A0ABR2NXF0_9ROSI